MAEVDGLVVPGGESTTVIRLLERFGLAEPITAAVRGGLPFWGTCMGLILAAREVVGLEQRTLGLIDVSVRRNAFGRQLASAEVALDVPVLGPELATAGPLGPPQLAPKATSPAPAAGSFSLRRSPSRGTAYSPLALLVFPSN